MQKPKRMLFRLLYVILFTTLILSSSASSRCSLYSNDTNECNAHEECEMCGTYEPQQACIETAQDRCCYPQNNDPPYLVCSISDQCCGGIWAEDPGRCCPAGTNCCLALNARHSNCCDIGQSCCDCSSNDDVLCLNAGQNCTCAS